jgi:hypothetical protein
MKHLKVDTAAPAVRKFFQALSIDGNGVGIELGGNLVCKIVPPSQLSDAEKSAHLADVRELLHRSRQRSKGVSARIIERDIRAALATVRGKRRQ